MENVGVSVLIGGASLLLCLLLLRALSRTTRNRTPRRRNVFSPVRRHNLREHIAPGAFPFPIIDGPEESRYLTWIRNHSNYMATRGARDYVRAISVLLRGILINVLVLLPYLLLISLLVAAHHWFLPPSFDLTVVVLICAAVAVLLFPLLTPLFRIARHRTRLRTGSDSSVKMRDRWERIYGAILILLLALAGFEALSIFLPDFHELRVKGDIDTTWLASVIAGAFALFTGADKLLNLVGGIVKKLVMLALGALGLFVPLLVVLFVAEYLVYFPPSRKWSYVNEFAYYIFFFVTAIAAVLGALTRSFTRDDFIKISLFLVVAFTLGVVLGYLDNEAWEAIDKHELQVVEALDVLDDASAAQLVESATQQPGQKLKDVFELQVRHRGFGIPIPAEAPPAPSSDLNVDPGLTHEPEALSSSMSWDDPLPSARDLLQELRHYESFVPYLSEVQFEIAQLPDEKLQQLSEELWDLIETADRTSVAWGFAYLDRAELVRSLIGDENEDLETVTGWLPLYPNYYPRHFDETAAPEFPVVADFKRELFNSAQREIHRMGYRLWEARKELALTNYYATTGNPGESEFRKARYTEFLVKFTHLSMVAGLLLALGWLTVDVNLTSIHGLYRDRLASAFLVGVDTEGDVDVEKDLDLDEICCHEAGSTAPYHLINVALNMQASRDMTIRDRKSDFFIFSKRFIGGRHTGYCRSESMEFVFPQMDLATAMAISAGAASPNMGRATTPALTALMILLNVRLGYWLPNPGRLESWLFRDKGEGGKENGYSFQEVFAEELGEIKRRWGQLDAELTNAELKRKGEFRRELSTDKQPTPEHSLVGIGFSGGGIRSATINLGITQALHRRGVFRHIDYMSTVSGGGYLGASISALMREKTSTISEIPGTVSVAKSDSGEKIVVSISPSQKRGEVPEAKSSEPIAYRYENYAKLDVDSGSRVKAEQRLIRSSATASKGQDSLGAQFTWRVRPWALLREVRGGLDESHRWVNVSDGGHIENLAGIELLRRKCRYVIIGDAEADPEHHFNGLATLIRSARIDLGVHIDIDVDALRLDKETRVAKSHWGVGVIHYPKEATKGYLLYIKSSVTGHEDEVINQYRHASPTFPHESTADQSFTEGQFEAYRSLGQHMAEQVLKEAEESEAGASEMSFAELESWFRTLQGRKPSPEGPEASGRTA